ncbi:hypothetical protein D3C87_1161780 [compost metagenome]
MEHLVRSRRHQAHHLVLHQPRHRSQVLRRRLRLSLVRARHHLHRLLRQCRPQQAGDRVLEMVRALELGLQRVALN